MTRRLKIAMWSSASAAAARFTLPPLAIDVDSETDKRFMQWWRTVGRHRFVGVNDSPQLALVKRELAYAAYLEGIAAAAEYEGLRK